MAGRVTGPFTDPPQVDTSIAIQAPIELVWSVMLDTAGYGEWNPFVVKVGAPPDRALQPSDHLALHVQWAGGRATRARELVTRLEPPAEAGEASRAVLVYEFRGWPYYLGLAKGRRTQSLEQRTGEPTVYRTTEHFGGLLKRFLPVKATQEGFERHASALRRRAESLKAERLD
jgi:hypothetical protein